jgi:hypothetical protein
LKCRILIFLEISNRIPRSDERESILSMGGHGRTESLAVASRDQENSPPRLRYAKLSSIYREYDGTVVSSIPPIYFSQLPLKESQTFILFLKLDALYVLKQNDPRQKLFYDSHVSMERFCTRIEQTKRVPGMPIARFGKRLAWRAAGQKVNAATADGGLLSKVFGSNLKDIRGTGDSPLRSILSKRSLAVLIILHTQAKIETGRLKA